MSPEEFQKVLPLVRDWISQTLTTHAPDVRSVESYQFPRLPLYFSNDILQHAKVVAVDKCPMPPLSAMGLRQFADFESMNASGVTYLDTYFVLQQEATRESLHFHELVHVIQWQFLGPDRFLAQYASGLEKHGYRNSPLEIMAYDHEARFKSSEPPYSVEAAVQEQLQKEG